MVSVHGEVDSSNAKQFAVAVCDAAANCSGLILDLTGLQFIAVDGFTALQAINAAMSRTDSSWQVAASPAALRLLALCDPEGLIPLASPEDLTFDSGSSSGA
jgi:anti-anti-sigma regulatory factor